MALTALRARADGVGDLAAQFGERAGTTLLESALLYRVKLVGGVEVLAGDERHGRWVRG